MGIISIYSSIGMSLAYLSLSMACVIHQPIAHIMPDSSLNAPENNGHWTNATIITAILLFMMKWLRSEK